MSRAERLLALMQVLRRHRRPVSGAALAEIGAVLPPGHALPDRNGR